MSPRVSPFVNNLFQNARVGMLRNKACAQHFQPFPRHLFHNRWIVQEPPAAEGKQVSKFPGDNAEFVLILPAQQADQETIFRKLESDILNGTQIGASDAVAGKTQCRIDEAANSDHQRHWQVEFTARGQDGFAEELRSNVVFWKVEC